MVGVVGGAGMVCDDGVGLSRRWLQVVNWLGQCRLLAGG